MEAEAVGDQAVQAGLECTVLVQKHQAQARE